MNYRRDLWKLFEGIPSIQLGGAAEIGVAEGNFGEEILNWPIKFPFVYLVDRWKEMPNIKGDSSNPQMLHDRNYHRVVARTQKFGARVVILREESLSAAEKIEDCRLSLVYIDADHSYESVKADLQAWFPKVMKGGYMAFHDYENTAYGVKRAVNEFCGKHRFEIFTLPEDKPEDAGAYFQC